MSSQEKLTKNWEGINEFFELKKIELTDMGVMVNKDAVSSEEKLIHRCASKISTDRQVNQKPPGIPYNSEQDEVYTPH